MAVPRAAADDWSDSEADDVNYSVDAEAAEANEPSSRHARFPPSRGIPGTPRLPFSFRNWACLAARNPRNRFFSHTPCGALVLPPSYLRLSRDAHANRFIQDLLSFDSEKTLHLHVSEELAD